jgi:hypothetical protein
MSLTVGNAYGMKGNEIYRLLEAFIFFPSMDVPSSNTITPSSSLGESGQSIMSSTKNSSRDWCWALKMS